jgi:hypothetical protein
LTCGGGGAYDGDALAFRRRFRIAEVVGYADRQRRAVGGEVLTGVD